MALTGLINLAGIVVVIAALFGVAYLAVKSQMEDEQAGHLPKEFQADGEPHSSVSDESKETDETGAEGHWWL